MSDQLDRLQAATAVLAAKQRTGVRWADLGKAVGRAARQQHLHPFGAPADVLKQFGGGQFSTFKNALVDLLVAKLGPINAEMRRLNGDPGYVDSVLADGSARAQAIAAETMKAVKDIVGFVRR
jgi:hypothetical protein